MLILAESEQFPVDAQSPPGRRAAPLQRWL